jgi:TonB family protein
MRVARNHVITLAIALMVFASRAVAVEGSLDEAKKLYAAASFESALALIEELDGKDRTSQDVLEYKALCLIALGRSGEAQVVIDALVSEAPAFLPTGEDISPRFVALLNDARRRLLPEITKRLFNAGREQFRAKNNTAAREQFDEVMRLADDKVWSDSGEATDLRTLASGFLELVDASPPAPVTIAAPVASARQRVELQPPVPIEQVLPQWRPADALTALRRFTGAVRVRIGKDGHVVNAAIEVATDPDYDKQLLEAARSWRYTPGRRNGEAIEMEKLVTFLLRLK